MKKFNAYIFSSKLQIVYYLKFALKNKLKYDILMWEKMQYIMNKTQFARGTEYIIRLYEKQCGLNNLPNNEYYHKIKRNIINDIKIHESQKPVSLLIELILLSSKENELICDPFIGSGSTAIAAINTNRNYIGFEQDKNCFNLAQNRIKNHIKDLENEDGLL